MGGVGCLWVVPLPVGCRVCVSLRWLVCGLVDGVLPWCAASVCVGRLFVRTHRSEDIQKKTYHFGASEEAYRVSLSPFTLTF